MTHLVLMLQLGKLDASYICASSGRVSSLYSMLSQTTDPSPEQQLLQQLQPYDCVFDKNQWR